MKKIGKKGWIAIGVVAVLLMAWLFLRGGKKEGKVSFETAKVENTNIHTSIRTSRVPRVRLLTSVLIIIGIRRSTTRGW